MCGIAGIYNRNGEPVSFELLKKMTDIIAYRGPDDEGHYINNNIGLGHRRLSIIDLSPSGHQPMCNEDESIWITYNGEVYNYLELMQELKSRGHIFKSKTDTEVILHSYEEYGVDCLQKFNGMFAFAIWDDNKKTLFCARDRLGIKPFYYYLDNKNFCFASEIKAIIEDKNITRQPNYDALYDYFTFQFTLGDKTFFQNIKTLLPGHLLTITENKFEVRKYWDINFVEIPGTEGEITAKIRKLLEDSVEKNLMSDVPIGSYLSGGIDSSSVASIASLVMSDQLNTFSGAFSEGGDYDERAFAHKVVTRAKTKHREVVPTAQDFITSISKIIWHLDEPQSGAGAFSQYMVAKLASDHVKVILTGHGGDELFAGYPRYIQILLEDSMRHSYKAFLTEAHKYKNLFGLASLLSALRRRLLESDDSGFHRIEQIKKHTRKKLLSKEFHDRMKEVPLADLGSYKKNMNTKNPIDLMHYIDIKLFLQSLLVVEDKISMANSIESRVPILDHRIVELSASIEPSIKSKYLVPKYLLKKAVCDLLPEEVIKHKKLGFPTPISIWFKRDLKEDIERILLSTTAQKRGIFNIEYIKRILYENSSNKKDHTRLIWMLLCVELWFKNFIDEQES